MNKPINNIDNIINFRYAPEKFIEWKYPDRNNIGLLKQYPKIFYQFGIVIWDFKNMADIKIFNNNNNNILCESINTCINLLVSKISSFEKINTIVFAGEDNKLSDNLEEINMLLLYCNKIYFEGKDIEHDKIKTIPMGLNMAYILRNGGNRILNIINTPKLPKQHLITCAYGNKWPTLNKTIDERQNLIIFCDKHKWIRKNKWKPLKYYKNLSKYKYFICPIGTGIQCPKIFECLLVKTIPVVLNHPVFRDIKSYGFPILIIEYFEQLNPMFLNIKYNSEYKNINWKKIIYKLTIKGFIEEILNDTL